MSDCLPCDLENAPTDAIVYRDDTWSCDVADDLNVPGWFTLRLRRHAEGWSALTADEAASFGVVSQRIARAIEAATGSSKVYFMSFGENYPHFHFLVTTRPVDLAPELVGAGVLARRATDRDHVEALRVAADIRSALVPA